MERHLRLLLVEDPQPRLHDFIAHCHSFPMSLAMRGSWQGDLIKSQWGAHGVCVFQKFSILHSLGTQHGRLDGFAPGTWCMGASFGINKIQGWSLNLIFSIQSTSLEISDIGKHMMAHGLPCLYAPALGGPSNWIVLGLKEEQRQQSCDFTRVSTIRALQSTSSGSIHSTDQPIALLTKTSSRILAHIFLHSHSSPL